MKRALPIAGFFGLVMLLAFWKPLFHPEYTLIQGGDMCTQTYPWFNAASHWLKRGVLLLWDPYVYSGKAALGELQPGILYPLNWLIWLLPDDSGGISIRGIEFLIILHCFLAGIFSFLLARSLGMRAFSAGAAGITYALGGFAAQLWSWVNIYSGFAWLPLAVLFFRRAWLEVDRRRCRRNLLGSAVITALAFLAGHHAPVIHTGLFLFVYVLARAALERKGPLGHAMFRGMAMLLVLVIGTGGLVAAQLLPSAEWASFALRWVGEGDPVSWGEKIPYSVLGRTGQVNPQDLLSFLLPYLTTSANLYAGAPVLFLALVGLLLPRGHDTRAIALMAFIYLFVSFGALTALHGWLNSFVPGLWFAREVYLYLVPLQLCLSLLAGWGLDRLIETYSGDADREARVLVRRSGWAMALLVLLAGVFSVAAHVFGGLALDHVYIRAGMLVAAYVTALGTLLFMLHTQRMRPTVFAGLLVALLALDLSSHFSASIQPATQASGQKVPAARDFWRMPRAAEYLQELRRHEVFRVDDLSHIFPPNFGDAWLLEETRGHGATARADYLAFRGTGWGPGSNATALLNARYFVSTVPVPGMPRPLAEEPLYRNIRALPRVFAAGRYRAFDSDRDLLNWLSTPLFAPGDSVLIYRGELGMVEPEFLQSVTREDEDLLVQPLSYWTAAERRAQESEDEQERHRLLLFRRPWGWSVGDELTFAVRPRAAGFDYYLVLDYWPAAADTSRLDIQLQGSGRSATVAADLPGFREGETPFAEKRHVAIPLGTLAAEEYRISFARADACSAHLDSIRVTRSWSEAAARGVGKVRLTSFRPARLKLEVSLKRSAFVVVSECWYPGWIAFVDGERAPLLKADHVLMAVPVPAGRHEVVLRFRSGTFRWGLLVSLFSLAALIAFLSLTAHRARTHGIDARRNKRLVNRM